MKITPTYIKFMEDIERYCILNENDWPITIKDDAPQEFKAKYERWKARPDIKFWDNVELYVVFDEEEWTTIIKKDAPKDFKVAYEKWEKNCIEAWEEYAKEAAKSKFFKEVWRYCIFDKENRFVGLKEDSPQDFKELLEEDLKNIKAGVKSWLSEYDDELDLTDIESWLEIIQRAGD